MVFGTEDDLTNAEPQNRAVVQQTDVIERALDHRLGRRPAEFLENVLLHRAGVYADADWQMAFLAASTTACTRPRRRCYPDSRILSTPDSIAASARR